MSNVPHPHRTLLVAVCSLLVSGCGDPGSLEELRALLRDRGYASWFAEPRPREPFAGSPHAAVRVFFDPTVEASLRSGATNHPLRSTLVKELYAEDRVTISGHAVMRKAAAEADGASWVFYEGVAPDDERPYYGRGLALCTSCHDAGVDQVLTPLPGP